MGLNWKVNLDVLGIQLFVPLFQVAPSADQEAVNRFIYSVNLLDITPRELVASIQYLMSKGCKYLNFLMMKWLICFFIYYCVSHIYMCIFVEHYDCEDIYLF